jgi:vancomycin resistance protein YoaR
MTSTTESIAGTTVAPATRTRSWTWLYAILGIGFGVLAALALAAGLVVAADQQYAGRVLPGVHVAGTDLSGLDRAEATAALTAALAAYGEGTIVVETRSGPEQISYAAIGRTATIDELVDQALAVGRDGGSADRLVSGVRNAVRGVEVEPRVVVDRARISAALAAIAARTDGVPVDASAEYSAEVGSVTPAVPGEGLDVAAATASIAAALSTTDAPAEITVTPTYIPIDATVSTEDAAAAVAAADRMQGVLQLAEGKDRWGISAAYVRSWISIGYRPDGSYGPVVDTAKAATTISRIAPKVERTAKSASFLLGKDGKIVGVQAGREGRTLDPDATAALVAQALLARAEDPAAAVAPVTIAVTPIVPAVTTAQAREVAPLMKRISTWTTNYEVSERNGFAANITIPTKIIDGTVVGPGEEFDFWKVVGIPTIEQGYQAGGAIINGHTEPTGAFAGGICSCSTTLFNAAVRAGFEILEREAHYYYISRYPLGLDATVWLTGSTGRSMRWRNDTDYPVLVRGYASPGVVRFDLYSVPTGRTVEFSKPVVTNYRAAGDYTKYTTTLPAGTAKRLEYPTAGMDTVVTRVVKDKDGTVIRTDTFTSHYAKVDGLTLIGKKKDPVPEPDATPEPTPEVPAGDGGVVPTP